MNEIDNNFSQDFHFAVAKTIKTAFIFSKIHYNKGFKSLTLK